MRMEQRCKKEENTQIPSEDILRKMSSRIILNRLLLKLIHRLTAHSLYIINISKIIIKLLSNVIKY